jgi:hypothetical protein
MRTTFHRWPTQVFRPRRGSQELRRNMTGQPAAGRECPTLIKRTFGRLEFVICFLCLQAASQDVQFLAEIDAHLRLNSIFRAYIKTKEDRDGGNPTQTGIGPSIQLYVKALLRLKKVTAFDLNESKSRFLVLEGEYRYIAAPDAPTDNRMLVAATLNFFLKAAFFISDRNRVDLDRKNGVLASRYHNKLALERPVAIHSYQLIPYLAAEHYYLSPYNKWSSTAHYAGCLFPVGHHVEFNTYYEHENNTAEHPNKPENVVGLALYLYFSVDKS